MKKDIRGSLLTVAWMGGGNVSCVGIQIGRGCLSVEPLYPDPQWRGAQLMRPLPDSGPSSLATDNGDPFLPQLLGQSPQPFKGRHASWQSGPVTLQHWELKQAVAADSCVATLLVAETTKGNLTLGIRQFKADEKRACAVDFRKVGTERTSPLTHSLCSEFPRPCSSTHGNGKTALRVLWNQRIMSNPPSSSLTSFSPTLLYQVPTTYYMVGV